MDNRQAWVLIDEDSEHNDYVIHAWETPPTARQIYSMATWHGVCIGTLIGSDEEEILINMEIIN